MYMDRINYYSFLKLPKYNHRITLDLRNVLAGEVLVSIIKQLSL